MILKYIHSDNTKELIELDLDVNTTSRWINISSSNKLEFIKVFLPAFYSGQKIVLFDSNHKQLAQFHQDNDISRFDRFKEADLKSQLLLFTSGSSGFPVGAFKTRENLLKEVEVLKELLSKYNIKRVVATVPFVHIYGVLAGLMLPLSLNDVKLIVKEDYLPYELLEEASHKNTLVITTPVFIKSLAKLSEEKDLSGNVFICSTGPLNHDDVSAFESMYQVDLLQLFGSTETGGIAYKFSDADVWTPLSSVKVFSHDDKLSIESPFISPYILNDKIRSLSQPFTTEDIVDIQESGFILLGRSNKIIKIAGKRISASQVESILESLDDVNAAVVELVYKKELLRSEQIKITLEANREISNKEIKAKINEYYGVLTVPFKVVYTDKINYSAMGKKVLF
ncbi:MAG: AMP-binding protein [Campylobacterota bacterium]